MRRENTIKAALAGAFIAWGAVASSALAGTVGSGVGFPELMARLGRNTPTGAGVVVAQVELTDAEGDYGPNQGAAAEYAGKTFYEMSGATGTSTHANAVGKNYYGIVSSIAPGITDIHLYEVNDWLNSGFLRSNFGSSTPPLTPPADLRIFNNSWVGNTANLVILRRAEYAAKVSNVLFVNAANNATGPTDNWPLLSHMYNGLCVGKSNGTNQTGDTLVDGAGRMKPEIVAPSSETSYSCAIVSASAALMYETAQNFSAAGSTDAVRAEVIKAVLLAGAKHRSGWTNNPATSGANRGITARPLDDTYGVDIVNVDNSDMILSGGEYAGANAPPNMVTAAHAGWALDAISLNSSKYWEFSVPAHVDQVSIIATWDRDMPIGFGTGSVADINLQLWRVDATGQLASLVGPAGEAFFASGNVVSNSSVDNIEHLFIRDLEPGAYVLEAKRVDNLTSYPQWDIAVAWLMPAPPCVADLVSTATLQPPPDGIVNGADLAILLSSWGPNAGAPADFVTTATLQPPPDGVVNGADLAILLSSWGPCN